MAFLDPNSYELPNAGSSLMEHDLSLPLVVLEPSIVILAGFRLYRGNLCDLGATVVVESVADLTGGDRA